MKHKKISVYLAALLFGSLGFFASTSILAQTTKTSPSDVTLNTNITDNTFEVINCDPGKNDKLLIKQNSPVTVTGFNTSGSIMCTIQDNTSKVTTISVVWDPAKNTAILGGSSGSFCGSQPVNGIVCSITQQNDTTVSVMISKGT